MNHLGGCMNRMIVSIFCLVLGMVGVSAVAVGNQNTGQTAEEIVIPGYTPPSSTPPANTPSTMPGVLSPDSTTGIAVTPSATSQPVAVDRETAYKSCEKFIPIGSSVNIARNN